MTRDQIINAVLRRWGYEKNESHWTIETGYVRGMMEAAIKQAVREERRRAKSKRSKP